MPGDGVLLRVDGTPIATNPTNWLSPGYWQEVCPAAPLPTPPFTIDVDASLVTDLAGNGAIASGCSFQVPPWRAPAGPGPIGPAGGSFEAAEVAIEIVYPSDPLVAWVPPIGAPSAGQVLASKGRSSYYGVIEGWNPAATLAANPSSSIVLAAQRAVWAEDASGTGVIRSAISSYAGDWSDDPSGPLNIDPAHDARHPAAALNSPGERWDGLKELVAWSESDGAGGRAIQARDKTWGVWTTIAGDVRSARSQADEAAVAVEDRGGPRIAATVDLAGALAWSQLAGTLNLDPSAAASSPTVLAGSPFVVAWTEGGEVLARTSDDPFGAAGFGAPASLNVDPAEVARSPRAAWNDRGAVVVFVEARPSGDEIWARRWNGTSWDLLPGPVNAGTAPGVRALSVARGPLIAWVANDGTIRIREGNF